MIKYAPLLIYGWAVIVTGVLSWLAQNPTPVIGAVLALLLFGLPLQIIWNKG